MKKRYLNLAVLLLLTVITSCEKDRTDIDDDKQKAYSKIILHIKTPSGFSTGAQSRSLTKEDENKIEHIWVLAFNAAGNLTEIQKGDNLTDIDATNRSFTATLQRSNSSADTYNLMVLANVEDIIDKVIGNDVEAITDKSYAAIASKLNIAIFQKMYTTSDKNKTIPMWGESGQLEIKLGLNNNISLSLMRAVARIDVGVGSPQQNMNGTYNWTGKNSNDEKIPFELKEVYVVKANNYFALVPMAANITNKKINAPTIPIGTTQFTIEGSILNFKYSDTDITASTADNGSYTTQSIYIPESDVKLGEDATAGDANHEKRMAIIVGGDYNNSGRTTYYRLDLAKNGDIMNILRNHLYQLNISKVSGFGYNDVTTAYNSLSMNMHVDILDWDEENMGDVIFDGQNYFSISKSNIEFSPMGKESEIITIKTNVKNLELWEQRDGEEYLEMKLGGTTTYTNVDMGYKYTLSTVTDGSYNLKIEATKHNVSNIVPNRLNKWRIKANRLNAKFEVDQQYTVLYVSYVNGQSQNLYPEGTMANTIAIDIMALKPVAIKAENSGGGTATWIDLGDIKQLTNGEDGLYQARLEINIEPFIYTSGVATLRTGTITVTPQDEAPRVFTINQESPIFKFAKNTETVSRKAGSVYHTYVDIITNLPESDFSIIEGTNQGIDAWRIKHKATFYNVDKTNPRSRRFDVDVDMQKDIPMSTDAFDKSFTATIDSKYGNITLPIVKFDVLKGSNIFDWFWKYATIPPLVDSYNFLDDDNAMRYIFPWQTKNTTIHFNSNNGLEYNENNANNKPRKGVLTKEESISGSDYITTPLIFTFNKENYNNADYYDLYFKSTLGSTPLVKNIKMGLGIQIWKRTPATTAISIGYKGYTQAAPYSLSVTSNVDWKANIDPTNATFIKMRPSATEAWVTLPISIDARVTIPEIIPTYNAEANLVKTNALSLAIEPYNTLNITPATREAQVKFVNSSYEAVDSKGGVVIADPTLTATQYAPVLTYVSGAPQTITYYGGDYAPVINVNTNIQSWGVRVYVGNNNSGRMIIDKAFGTSTTIPDKAATSRSITITIPRYNAESDRNLSFYIYHTQADIETKEIFIRTAIQAYKDYFDSGNVRWKLGNLVGSGKYSATVGAHYDTGLYFKNGSLIGWEGATNPDGTYSPTSINTSVRVYTYPTYYNTDWLAWGSVSHYNGNGMPEVNMMSGHGDPCRYYLGNPWRTPTQDECSRLLALGAGNFMNMGGKTNGVWLANRIFFTASGRREMSNGSLIDINTGGGYLSSTYYNTTNNHGFEFSNTLSFKMDTWNRKRAYPVRCVRSI